MIDVAADASFGQQQYEWFRWTLPPGVTELELPIAGKARLWVDGEEIAISEGKAYLDSSQARSKKAALRVFPEQGRTGGAVFTGPVRYQTSTGKIQLGDWSKQGLESYSGGVRYRTSIQLDQSSLALPLLLDLGQVRGTAEIRVNGQEAGVCIWSPYRVDISPYVAVGQNKIEVVVYNTLAPYLHSVSPTHYIFEGQTISGIMGPVQLLTTK